MLYLSQLLNKTIYFQDKPFAKLIDLSVSENRPVPAVSKIVFKKNDKKLTITPSVISFENGRFILKTQDVPFLPYDEKDFYLNEDLLDKQVIDIDGRRLVRVNDVLLESNGEMRAMGIDIGFSGILRRLGLERLIPLKNKTLPWSVIEAFDFQTGAIRIKLTQDRLNTFHPAELADILEELGIKERLGVFEVLDAQKAAEAIEEADTQTQSSILEDLKPENLKKIVEKMPVSEIADLVYKVNPLRIVEIFKSLDTEKVQKVERLSVFPDDTAGGLMDLSFCLINGEKTVKEALSSLSEQGLKPEVVVVANGNNRTLGIIYAKAFINIDPLALLKDVISERKFVSPEASFGEILRLFSQYNLRILPVVDKDKKILGIITIDTILSRIEEEKEKNELL